jgi:hypothetical protein
VEYPVHWGIVFSDVVLRSAEALKQYRLAAPSWDESLRFEATLTLSVTQTILAATKELHDALQRQRPDAAQGLATDLTSLFEHVQLEDTTWLAGASGDSYVTRQDLTGAGILEHLRNAMSHPVRGLPSDLPMTGYATVPRDGHIHALRFTHSPWVHRDRKSGEPVVIPGGRRKIDPENRLVTSNENGKILHLPGQSTPYYPYIKMQVTVDDLGRICEAIAESFERWQKELSPGSEPSPDTVRMALATALR